MAIMRVYEFSKQHDISTKELIEALKKGGFDVRSHMSMLDQPEIDFLNKQFIAKKTSEKKATQKPSTPASVLPAPSEQAMDAQKSVEKTKEAKAPVEKEMQKNTQAPRTPPVMTEQLKSASKPVFQPSPATTRKEIVSPVATPIEIIAQPMSVDLVAQKLHRPVNEVIVTLLGWGVIANKNQVIPENIVIRLAERFEATVIRPTHVEKESVHPGEITGEDGDFIERPPVVVVLGHVDHGKTTLLDYIRKTRVASREKGGITQHLGAYQAIMPHGSIVFIDTPGHEAFSKMRMRGVRVADIAVLVVAADDGVMPQTIEALKHAKAMKVPIVVAVNKMDKVDKTRLEGIRRELAQHDLTPEDWGGDTTVVPISAKEGTGVDNLLEVLILQAQIMGLRSKTSVHGKGYVLESKIEKGHGPVATLLVQHGTVSVGDYFVCGQTTGRVTALVDSFGKRLNTVGASMPVQVSGFSEMPEAGESFEVVTKAQQLSAVSAISKGIKKPMLERISTPGDVINIIVKTDTHSSREALLGAIAKTSKKFEKKFNVIDASVGGVSESDIALAITTHARIVTLHVKIEPNALALAKKHELPIERFDIIYKLIERLEEIAEGAKVIKKVLKKIGEAEVRKVFDIKKLGVIAGCYVKEGRFVRDGKVIILRGNKKIGEGPIQSLQRDKKVVKEVHANYECAFLVKDFTDWQEGDRVECYQEVVAE